MQQSAKLFAENLNKILDELDLPNNSRERSAIFSKMIDIPKQQAWSLLEGHVLPSNELLEKIAAELEVDSQSLLKPKK